MFTIKVRKCLRNGRKVCWRPCFKNGDVHSCSNYRGNNLVKIHERVVEARFGQEETIRATVWFYRKSTTNTLCFEDAVEELGCCVSKSGVAGVVNIWGPQDSGENDG